MQRQQGARCTELVRGIGGDLGGPPTVSTIGRKEQQISDMQQNLEPVTSSCFAVSFLICTYSPVWMNGSETFHELDLACETFQ